MKNYNMHEEVIFNDHIIFSILAKVRPSSFDLIELKHLQKFYLLSDDFYKRAYMCSAYLKTSFVRSICRHVVMKEYQSLRNTGS